MNNVSVTVEDLYLDELEADLGAHKAVVNAIRDLFIGAELDDDATHYCVDAGKLNAVMDLIEMLRE